MDRIDAMRVFTRVFESRSFTQASEDLGLPRSTVTEAVKQIESRLNVRLLERTTRQVMPTLDGEAFYHRCLSIISDVDDAEHAFSGTKPKGMLRVDVHGTLARHFLLPHLPEFLRQYPDIKLFLSEGDRLADVVREGIDCVLRVGTPQAEDLVAQRIYGLEEITVASPDYLASYGIPTHPDELLSHKMIGFRVTGSSEPLPLEFMVGKKPLYKALRCDFMVNSAETLVKAAVLGLGIVQVPKYHIENELVNGTLVSILPEYPPAPSPVSVLYPRNRRLSTRVRVFTDWLREAFSR